MSKEMIVSVNGREKKIAILDNGKVTEFYIERGEENSGVVGNVYKGRVMRVLPGMQSAFVDIGLERDAFLYVSDFFDEDEEIERIVMNKKGSPEEAKREANEQIDRSRIEREKQMDSTQELAEPLAETRPVVDEPAADIGEVLPPSDDPQPAAEERPEKGKRSRGGRGRKGKDEPVAEPVEEAPQEPLFEIEFDNSGFERISDDSDTGEMFKDAYVQEAIVNRVRAVEFEMETTAEAEVGSLLGEVGGDAGGFERIADEEETPAPAPAKGRRKTKAAAAEEADEKPAPKKKAAAKRAPAKGKFSKTSKTKKAKGDGLEDAEASVKEPSETAEMAVRRGGRGRRRGGKKGDEGSDESLDNLESGDDEVNGNVAIVEASEPERDEPSGDQTTSETQTDPSDDQSQSDDRPRGRDRDRNRRGGRGRNDRQSGDRPNNDRPSGDRNERQGGDGKRFDRNDRGGRPAQPTISDLLREGQEILVQIAKEPIAKKVRASLRTSLCRDAISFICRQLSISACRERSNLRPNATACER
ncbi:MAG: hypothetical protein QM785_06535 [Pyrinomonadaceae bacterium]